MEETSKKEAAVEEKTKKQGVAKRKYYALTPTSCSTRCFTKKTERNVVDEVESGERGGNVFP